MPHTQRRWTVPPNFSSFLPHLTELGLPIDLEDPFYTRPTVPELLKGLGVINDDAPIAFLSSSSVLILRTNAKNQVKIDGLVSKAISEIPYLTRISFPDDPTPNLGVLVPPDGLGILQRSGTTDESSPDLQFLVASFEQGFGREIKMVAFTDDIPSAEDQALFLETGSVSDLGVSENLSQATFNITRESYENEAHAFTFKDKNGTLHELSFVSERIDAAGKTIAIPELHPR